MPEKTEPRPHSMTLRLSDDEKLISRFMAKRNGIDISGAYRQAMLRWAREDGVTVEMARAEFKEEYDRRNAQLRAEKK